MTYVISPASDAAARMKVVGPYASREAAIAAASRSDHIVSSIDDVIWSGQVLVDVFNAVTGLMLKRFETSEIGRKRLMTQLERYAVAPAETVEETVMAETNGTGRGRAGKFAKTAVITKLNDVNPCRAGTASFTRAALFKSGQTVAEYMAAGGRWSDIHSALERQHISVA